MNRKSGTSLLMALILVFLTASCLGCGTTRTLGEAGSNSSNSRVLYYEDDDEEEKDDYKDDYKDSEEYQADDKNIDDSYDDDVNQDEENTDDDNLDDEYKDDQASDDESDDVSESKEDLEDYRLIGNDDLGYTYIPNWYVTYEYADFREGTLAFQSLMEDLNVIQLIPNPRNAEDVSLMLLENLGRSGDIRTEARNGGNLIIAEDTNDKYPLIMMHVMEAPNDEEQSVVLAFEFTENSSENEKLAMDIIDMYSPK